MIVWRSHSRGYARYGGFRDMRPRRRTDQSQGFAIKQIEEKERADGTVDITFKTNDGDLKGIYHPVENAHAAVVMVGGTGGGVTGPASVYPDLAKQLSSEGIASMRLDYRYPAELDDSVIDVIVALQFLDEEGIDNVGLVGWSFGGAVVITAGAVHENVSAVATVATQSAETEGAEHLGDIPVLLLHGTADNTLSPVCSEKVYESITGPKELKIYEGANHGLDEVRVEMLAKLKEFFVAGLE